jgi:hypothetical protein
MVQMKGLNDKLSIGVILGFIAPVLGLLIFKWSRFGVFSYKEFFQFIFLQPGFKVLSAGLSVALLANALVFTICINTRKDNIAKGVFVSTCLYGLVILLIKTFA